MALIILGITYITISIAYVYMIIKYTSTVNGISENESSKRIMYMIITLVSIIETVIGIWFSMHIFAYFDNVIPLISTTIGFVIGVYLMFFSGDRFKIQKSFSNLMSNDAGNKALAFGYTILVIGTTNTVVLLFGCLIKFISNLY